jgi:uncharacterized protein (TIGR03435 family)
METWCADLSGRRDASIEPSAAKGNKLGRHWCSKLLHGEYKQWYHRRVNRKSKKMRMAGRLAILAVPIALSAVSTGQSQSQAQTQSAAVSAPIYEYDVVSIKLNKSGDSKHFMVNFPGEGISAENISLRLIVQYAFGFNDSTRFSPMPSWVDTERYDIEAKVEPSLRETLYKLSREERNPIRQQMIQALLRDRMGFTFHRETREIQVYTLTVEKGGPKFQASKPPSADPDLRRPPIWATSGRDGVVTLTGERVDIAFLARMLTLNSHRPVIDKTIGLTGTYDMTLRFVPEDGQVEMPGGRTPLEAPDPVGQDLVSAVKDQLGLKLESGKGPVEVIVIDHIERPSGN